MTVNVVIIDDDKLIHKIVTKSLSDEFNLHSAYNADEGKKLAAELQPDVILLDIEMPGQNGYECCEELKATSATKNIPVVFLSAKTSLRERMLGYESGADDYLVKPFETSELNAKLKVAAKYKSQRDNLENEVEFAQNTALDVMTGNSELGSVMRFVEATYGISQIETLAQQLLELTSTFGLNCSLLFDYNDDELTYSSSGILSPIEIELLSSCRNTNRFIDFGCRTIINYPKVSLLVKNMPLEDAEKYGRYKDVLPTVLSATEAKISLMETNNMLTSQSERTNQAFSNIRHSMKDLLRSMHHHQESATKSISELSVNMQAKLPSLGLEEDQEEFILDSIEKTFNEVTSQLANSKQVQITFVTVLKEMKSLVTELESVLEATQQDVIITHDDENETSKGDDNYQMDIELF